MSPTRVYRAFTRPGAMEQWIPPEGMVGSMFHFDFREGGSYRMRLTYVDPRGGRGKAAEDFDEIEVRLVSVSESRRIEQEIEFTAEDASFAGVMQMVWTFEPEGRGTLVTVRAKNVPEGIRPEDHEVGMKSTLENLDRFLRTGQDQK